MIAKYNAMVRFSRVKLIMMKLLSETNQFPHWSVWWLNYLLYFKHNAQLNPPAVSANDWKPKATKMKLKHGEKKLVEQSKKQRKRKKTRRIAYKNSKTADKKNNKRRPITQQKKKKKKVKTANKNSEYKSNKFYVHVRT